MLVAYITTVFHTSLYLLHKLQNYTIPKVAVYKEIIFTANVITALAGTIVNILQKFVLPVQWREVV